jgi:hypothetical protein
VVTIHNNVAAAFNDPTRLLPIVCCITMRTHSIWCDTKPY